MMQTLFEFLNFFQCGLRCGLVSGGHLAQGGKRERGKGGRMSLGNAKELPVGKLAPEHAICKLSSNFVLTSPL